MKRIVYSFWFRLVINNSPYLYRGSYRKSARCRCFKPFTIGSPVKDKQHFHARYLVSYLVYGSEVIVWAEREVAISETNLLIVGLVAETGRHHSFILNVCQPGCHKPNSPWPGIIKLFPARESCWLVTSRRGDGKIANLFLQCICFSFSRKLMTTLHILLICLSSMILP